MESEEFLGKTGQRTLFSIECINGKFIVNHSYFKQAEKEVILMPGSYFEVIGQLKPAPQLLIIHLKEIEPPFLKSDHIDSSSVINQSKKNPQPTSNIIQQKNIQILFQNQQYSNQVKSISYIYLIF